jgi:DNA (cytosine-5)-methyltransferase 1
LYNTRIHREFLAKLECKLERAGYCLDLRVLNALELGVPQDRERLIMIGIKRALATKCLGREIAKTERGWFSWPQLKYKDAKNIYVWPTTVKQGASPVKPSDIPEELTVYHWINSDNPPEKVRNGKDTFKVKSNKFYVIQEGDTKRKSFKRLHRFRFSPTVCYGHNEVHLHPWEHRRLSVREAMRIQGIPDTYVLPEEATLTSKFRVVSNGVPVPLAYEVARSLKKFLGKIS